MTTTAVGPDATSAGSTPSVPAKPTAAASDAADTTRASLNIIDEDTTTATCTSDDDAAFESARESTSSIDHEPPVVGAEHKDSFFTFLRKIMGQDVDSLRIPVPLFLLEPVSNLEYLADLEHVENFVAAADEPTPLARLLAVVRVLATGLKKGLKKAKKPLNPVLGEVFFSEFASKADANAPVVQLVGEQVSHHPPISAFHASCPDRGADVTLVFDLKAKYNGLSFGLHNDSWARVHLATHNEDYYLTYPHATLAGVLTMNFTLLWHGSCTVECPQTNLQATLHFKEQKWFGRTSHAVHGTVHKIDDHKSVLGSFAGAWNDVITFHPAAPESSDAPAAKPSKKDRSKTKDKKSKSKSSDLTVESDTELVVPILAVHTESEYATHVIPETQCPPHASRNVWSTTMAAMRAGKASAAAAAKAAVENAQRALAKKRADGNAPPYVPAFFEGDPRSGPRGNVRYIGPKRWPGRERDYNAVVNEWTKPCGEAGEAETPAAP
ncbi:hypothetical protein AMAG_01672 [Allomyces macrogynus ATCC 38327]|uniref:Oxysterol-binding protein n=1 Tax=Allomyces macrogynus (strain ATCC 38327) TaxID=578462 RepID=A0A0L0S0E6_ALLM3|nr:hypothetical protein AMAG_01672 [Allomyces macrogynus ATCC 38327]|eukprot:KNE55799.1 hypothetical protein AMAG_01672 [Allomyces macrogynus ATCC 38327]